jgi:glyoxylase-like metal-dependent hydrolase (beta-lactamase superfamily II)
MMGNQEFKVIDLFFQGQPQTIASYAFPHSDGVVLIESGPGSTANNLKAGLNKIGYSPHDVTHVLLTHIHLDHAGAAGWLAKHGAEIFVHQIGAPHLLDPSRLLSSAKRIYQDQMDELWGNFLPVPEKQLTVLEDGDLIQVGKLEFRAVDTPGHAYHHHAYLFKQVCFSGDVGAVRIPGLEKPHLRLPMPPPEFHPDRWRSSIERLKKEKIQTLVPTHFGIYQDVEWHLDQILRELDAAESWMKAIMPRDLPLDDLRTEFVQWATDRSIQLGIDPEAIETFEKANPSGMSADGIKRYWDKYCKE